MMKWLLPSRRYTILAPLAILLPAGLLAYLGYQTVQGIDLRVEEQIKSIAFTTRNGFRDRVTYRLNYSILNTFQNNFIRILDELFPTASLADEYTFTLEECFPFASGLFVLMNDGNLFYFECNREHSDEKKAQWRLTKKFNESFISFLKYKIQSAPQMLIQESLTDLFSPSNYIYVPYPEDPLLTIPARELAALTILPSSPEERTGHDISHIHSVGFTFDFEYLNLSFFPDILEQIEIEGFSIALFDRFTSETLAAKEFYREIPFMVSSKYRPETFNEAIFPWYMISYSNDLGYQEREIAQNEKIVYLCLISAAIIIMILGVIGTQRSIMKELELAEMRSDFVARVSHELRTPIGLIRLYSETLELGRMNSERKSKEYLHAITKESERLSHLINNILDFSQIEANKKNYSLTEQPVERIVCDTVNSMRYHFERNGLDLILEMEPDLPNILCDPDSFSQALYNLLSNAMKYSGDGKEVRVGVKTVADEIHIHIQDHGIGIEKDQHRKIFQKFYRVDHPNVRKTGGSGLGLSVVQHIIQNHHGRIDVDSVPGKGSTFTIRVPSVPDASHRQSRNPKT